MKYRSLLLPVWLVACAVTVSAASRYTVTDLGPVFGYPHSAGYAVNSSGQVAGASWISGAPGKAVLWQDGATQDLGYGQANGLNEAGQVVGEMTFDSGLHAFVWDNGHVQDLGTLDKRFNLRSGAYDINNLGRVVGYSITPAGGYVHAVLWLDGVIQDLGTLPGGNQSFAYSISDSGLVAGQANTPSGQMHAVLWRSGVPQDIGTFNWDHSYAYGVNDCGQVVGALRQNTGYSRAFIWQNGAINIFGGDDSVANGINSRGDVVGTSNTEGAFLWQYGVMHRLADLVAPDSGGWVLNSASAISDDGKITGFGIYNAGVHAFLLTPIPEPSSILALAGGLAGLLGITRRKA